MKNRGHGDTGLNVQILRARCGKRRKATKMQKTVKFNESGRIIGENHPNAKLLDHEVDLVFELRASGVSRAQIAEKMGVSIHCIAHILCGRRRGQSVARTASVSVTE